MSTKEDVKPEQSVSDAIKEAIKEALPMAAAMAAQASAAAQPKPVAGPGLPFLKQNKGKCSECGQFEAACKNEHRLACVFPDDEEIGTFFQGVKINGVRYMSNGPGHLITVPKDSNVEYMVSAWVSQEKVLRTGRKMNRNSGSIGGTNNFKAYNGGDWNGR